MSRVLRYRQIKVSRQPALPTNIMRSYHTASRGFSRSLENGVVPHFQKDTGTYISLFTQFRSILYIPKRHKNATPFFSAGFSLIELLTVISIIALLSTVVLAALSTARKSARDAQRISMLRQMQTALEFYYHDNNTTYPAGDGGVGAGVPWDTAGNGTFITALVPTYLPTHLRDPLVNDNTGNLRYARYAAGANGCPASRGAYYVLGVADMETSAGAHPLSPGFSCGGGGTDFGTQMEYVIGKFEK